MKVTENSGLDPPLLPHCDMLPLVGVWTIVTLGFEYVFFMFFTSSLFSVYRFSFILMIVSHTAASDSGQSNLTTDFLERTTFFGILLFPIQRLVFEMYYRQGTIHLLATPAQGIVGISAVNHMKGIDNDRFFRLAERQCGQLRLHFSVAIHCTRTGTFE